MNSSLKQYKDTGYKVHEQLYQNVLVLTHVYPTSREFDMVFKKDMFVKSNKTAFHQVVYYLLRVLNRELTQEKISSWPPFEIKLETKFRNEVLSYVNQLSSIYEDCKIANIMSSHLITPGGFKFAKFMLQLSQFVLFQHVKKSEPEMLLPIRPHKNSQITSIITNNLKETTSAIEAETRQLYEKFNGNYVRMLEEASTIIFEQTQLNNDMHEISQRLVSLKQALEGRDYPSKESLYEKLETLKSKMSGIVRIRDLCKKGDELLACVSYNNSLQYNKEDVTVPDEIAQFIVSEDDKLDLELLFKGLIVVLENQNSNMPAFTTVQLNDAVKTMEKINYKYVELDKKLTANKNKLTETLNKDINQPELCQLNNIDNSFK